MRASIYSIAALCRCGRSRDTAGSGPGLPDQAGDGDHARGRRQQPGCRHAHRRRQADAAVEAADHRSQPPRRRRRNRGAGRGRRGARRLHALHDAGLELHRAAGAAEAAVRHRPRIFADRAGWRAADRRDRDAVAAGENLARADRAGEDNTWRDVLRRHQSRRAIAPHRRTSAHPRRHRSDFRPCTGAGGLAQRRDRRAVFRSCSKASPACTAPCRAARSG